MTRKIISITVRPPRTRTEHKRWGETYVDRNIAEVFINQRRNRRPIEHLDTLYHELTHAIIGLYKTRVSSDREEALCRKIGEMAVEAFTNG